MWKLFQISVFLTVMFTGIYFEWTPNGYVLSLLSIGAAFFATLILSEGTRLLARTFQAGRGLLGKQSIQNRPPRGW
jgi:hypothetical protein